ncbi:type VI secretion system Vgr family protein [Massilia yuzhufengensis]|uniref:Type VI secretion system Vgr family protein n=1 Tax=Massilia yuzhufengensis TaxID=1164594 RepID=A0A1I1UQZ7_9BURK|nr:type VI secretion system Vgr family protein [Massilia yuzhufengensis]SFD73124.1 type VI secretion system Vgr family protein [Massilia yuzhufengensis]
MTPALAEQLATASALFSSENRLYELTVGDGSTNPGIGSLLVEAFIADEALNELSVRDVIVLSTSIHVEFEKLLGRPARMEISLADGTRACFQGEVSEVAMLGSDGGFARYRIRLSPWLWRLGQVRNSRVWQDKTVIEIVDSVFGAYLPAARWRWSDETSSFMAVCPPRPYRCQYRESDLAFVRRILAEEGLNWRFERTEDGAGMVLFADSSHRRAVPEDPGSAMEGGIRYHGVSALERQDTVQALVAQRRIHSSLATVLSYDYEAGQIVAAGSPSRFPTSRKLPALEAFDVLGSCAIRGRGLAQDHADVQMEGQEARSQLWRGRSTVRTLCAGTRMTITGTPLQELGEAPAFTLLRVMSVGVNNLPPPAQHALAELFGSIPELLQDVAYSDAPGNLELVIDRAIESGYANCFEAIPAALPWRPQLPWDADSAHPKPTANGSQSAIVIGPDGRDQPHGAEEQYCDRLGRIRIRFHWQENCDASCWVRVAQRAAGGGMGSQFLPRIGHEVMVQFLENDIDQPIVIGSLYNGQGEGGTVPTPGGAAGAERDPACFARANDHMASAQANLADGNSPVWHGASHGSDGHRNAAAQWGMRSKEFGGSGYSQLLFDDTDTQGRIHFKCTHAATELSLGHLIHAADNYRGSFRGLGAALHTNTYGAVRAAGLLVTSYGVRHESVGREPVGENAAPVGLLGQGIALAASLHAAAKAHQTVGYASHDGALQADASVLDKESAPLKAMLASVAGTGEGKLPYSRDPIMTSAAKDGFSASAGQSIQLANGETVVAMSGLDTQFAAGGQTRLQTGQAIGVLGGALKSGDDNVGLQMIAAKDCIDIQAQADGAMVQARDQLEVSSASMRVDLAAAKRISLSTAGGANIVIDGGNITLQCPGTLKAQAGKKSFTDPTKLGFDMPALPRSVCIACLKKSLAAGPAFTMVE